MSRKYPLGPRRVVAKADTTGNNAGNYTAVFDPNTVNINYTLWEVYKMVVTIPTADGIGGWQIFIGINQYEGYQSSGNATWSDPQPMVVDSGETVYFYFNIPTSKSAPTVILWTQVDLDIAKQGAS